MRIARPNQKCATVLCGSPAGFTLLEVMIAMAIFFMAIFAILGLTSRNLNMARSLHQNFADPGLLAAELSLTNRLEEGIDSGDFGDLYPSARWTRETTLVSTNGLYLVDFVVQQQIGKAPVESRLSILLYKPETGGAGAGAGARIGTGTRR
jgi:hypothetical protein